MPTPTTDAVRSPAAVDAGAVRRPSAAAPGRSRRSPSEFGVTHRTVRHYEELGLISPERRGTTRVYHRRDRTRLALILRGKRLGFPLEEIRTIIDLYDVPRGRRSQLEYVLGQIDERRADLEQRRRDIDAALSELTEFERRCRVRPRPPGLSPARHDAVTPAVARAALTRAGPASRLWMPALPLFTASCHPRVARPSVTSRSGVDDDGAHVGARLQVGHRHGPSPVPLVSGRSADPWPSARSRRSRTCRHRSAS